MSDAVIVDDGGSTRIKQLSPGGGHKGDLAALLTDRSATAHGFFTVNGSPRCTVTVIWFPEGDVAEPLQAIDMHLGDQLIIDSEYDHRSVFELGRNGTLNIDIAKNREPFPEAKNESRKQFRYVVSNSGAIQAVTYKPAVGLETPIFPAAGSSASDSLYTTVIFS